MEKKDLRFVRGRFPEVGGFHGSGTKKALCLAVISSFHKHCMKLKPNCKRRLANRIFLILLLLDLTFT